MNKAGIFNRTLKVIALLGAIWFVLTGWCWFYFLNVIFSIPLGILSFFIWYKKKEDDRMSKITIGLLKAGIVLSILGLITLVVLILLDS